MNFSNRLFPTPQGNVYIINDTLEVANIPIGTGLAVAICPSENLLYLKTFQNGQILTASYTLTLCEQPSSPSQIEKALQDIIKRLEKLEKEEKLSDLI